MTSLRPTSSRFCYTTLKGQGSQTGAGCCSTEQQPITAETLSTMASLPCVINNSRGTTSQSLLLSNCYLQPNESTQRLSAIQAKVSTLLGTAPEVDDTLRRQLAAETSTRYDPYRPRIPEFIPSSVLELEMRTRNVGVPVPVMTIAKCKGVQFITT